MSSTSKFAFTVLLLGIACNLLLKVEAQLAANIIQNPCVNKRSCHECIQTQSCAWCMQPNHGDKPRCFQPSYTNICPEEYTWNPDTEQTFIVNRALTRTGYAAATAGGQKGFAGTYEANSGNSSSIVQMSPQRISLKLRIDRVHSLPLHYSQAKDYPVDLYYLMDLSKSMEDDKNTLSALGNSLSETMRNLTSNFRLGFGSFVDKVTMPFVSTIPKK